MSNYILINGTLYHHGIKGQKWGNRRWQNEDGSLTPAGREHYGYGEARTKLYNAKQAYKQAKKDWNKQYNRTRGIRGTYLDSEKTKTKNWSKLIDATEKEAKAKEAFKKAKQEYKKSDEYKQAKDKTKKALIAGAAVAGTALAVYGGYKLSKAIKDKAFESYVKNGSSKAFSILEDNTVHGWSIYDDNSFKLYGRTRNVLSEGKAPSNVDTVVRDLAYKRNKAAEKDYSNAMDKIFEEGQEMRKSVVSSAKYLYDNSDLKRNMEIRKNLKRASRS